MKKPNKPKTISNRRARHDYSIEDILTVGIQLTGAETKALRHGHGNLRGAYVTLKDGELWLVNATISSMPGITIEESQTTRSRKLLAHQREINRLIATKQQGRTIVPLDMITQGRFIKLRIASARGKKQYDKRQTIRQREETRRTEQAIKMRRA